MLAMSFWGGLGSMVTALLWWTIDWWRPATLFGTRVGIEDVLLGIANGGTAAVLYEVVFRKRLAKMYARHGQRHILVFLVPLACFVSMSVLFYALGFSSFFASAVSMFLAALILVFLRPDLLVQSFATGALMAIIMMPVYWILIALSPGWIQATWIGRLSGLFIFGIPIEDVVFYMLLGFLIGPLYEFWQGYRTRNIPTATK